jgi:hypothetical protein
MSTYCTIEGSIKYKTKESFDTAISTLKNGSWMNDKGYFIAETGEEISKVPDVDFNNLSLTIPCFHYRNLGYVLKSLVKNTQGNIIWTCSDGCFNGGVITNGKEKGYDLRKWAKRHMSGYEEEPDMEDVENHSIWEQEIENAFMSC